MKKTIIALFFIHSVIFGQIESQFSWISKFGLAGGLTTSWISPNFDEINNQLPQFGINDKFDGGIITWGGSGYVYVMLVDDLRIGGMGFGGTKSVISNSNGFNREVKYGLSGGAFTIEYTLPFVKRIAVSLGGMIGGGKLTIEQFQNDEKFSWQDTWNEFNNIGGTQNISRKMENNYLTISPIINVDVPLNRFFAIRIGSGYQFAINEKWTIENEKTLTNVPSSVNGNAFFIQTGIYLGFFAY